MSVRSVLSSIVKKSAAMFIAGVALACGAAVMAGTVLPAAGVTLWEASAITALPGILAVGAASAALGAATAVLGGMSQSPGDKVAAEGLHRASPSAGRAADTPMAAQEQERVQEVLQDKSAATLQPEAMRLIAAKKDAEKSPFVSSLRPKECTSCKKKPSYRERVEQARSNPEQPSGRSHIV